MKSIALIEASDGCWETGLYCRHTKPEPLGLEYIGASATRYGHEVQIIQQENLSEGELLERIYELHAEIVGFSVLTYNADATKNLCRKIKKNDPRIITVVGGYHPTAVPSIVEDANIDYAVLREGDKAFIELVRCLGANGDASKVEGIAFYDNGVKTTKPQNRIDDLDSLPAPLRSRSVLRSCRIDGLVYPPPSQQNCIAQVLYSRGCSYNCTFCCSPSVWGWQVKFRSPKKVIKEIKILHAEFGTNLIFFTDLSFNLRQKKVL